MYRPAAVRALVVCLSCLALACGDDIGSKRPGEPCTRTDQCMTGLSCLDGVCRDPIVPGDGGAAD